MASNRDRDEPAERTVLGDWLGGWLDASLSRDAVRSMTEISQRGIEAAATIVERMTELVDGSRDGGSASKAAGRSRTDESAAPFDRWRSDAMRAIEVWADAMVELVDAAVGALAGAGAASVSDALRVGPVAPGEHAEAAVHVHGTRGQGMVRFDVGSLETATGSGLPKGAASVVPDAIAEGDDRVPVFAIDVPEDADPGVYHGYVFAIGADEVSIPVTVRVSTPKVAGERGA